jgi:hypothetical protein
VERAGLTTETQGNAEEKASTTKDAKVHEGMGERRQFEFFLLRYVPYTVRERFVDFGVILQEKGDPEGFAEVRFARDWQSVREMDPQADVEVLEALQREIAERFSRPQERENLLKMLEDSFSNVVQCSPKKACLTDDPAREIELLAAMYLNPPTVAGGGQPKAVSGRQGILSRMRDEFERAGVWKFLMHGVPVAPYTREGDPFKFDFGYRFGGEIKLFHAVSMKASVDSAVMLAARYPRIMPTMTQVTGATPVLTAVVEDGLDRGRSEVEFALEMMEESKVRVATTAEMAGIAGVARVELRA